MRFEEINTKPIESFLRPVVLERATDLLLAAGTPPRIRVEKRLQPIQGEAVLTDDVLSPMILSVLPEKLQNELHETHEVDFSFTFKQTHRFRGNCFVTQ